MNEQTAGRLELTSTRAQAFFGSAKRSVAGGATAESTGDASQAPASRDVPLIAARIQRHSTIEPDAALAIATEIVERARVAVTKLDQLPSATLSEQDALALESVIHVRGRPALRVFQNRLESLELFPGSELWQDFITDYEERIIAAAAATGAALVTAFETGNPAWVQGSAWLVGRNRVVTNRHVLVSDTMNLLKPAENGSGWQIGDGYAIAIEFAADDRDPRAKIRRRVTEVLYVAEGRDPVDIAVLGIEPDNLQQPLTLTASANQGSKNLFVVGHPGQMSNAPEAVKAVFGNPDGRKRVSFGKRLEIGRRTGEFGHDASTIGGYSGGPVVRINDGMVAGLHYYGDPATGNLAIDCDAIRAHAAYQFW